MGSQPSFDNLPVNLLLITSEHLDPQSLLQLSLVNRNTWSKMILVNVKRRMAALVRQRQVVVKTVCVGESFVLCLSSYSVSIVHSCGICKRPSRGGMTDWLIYTPAFCLLFEPCFCLSFLFGPFIVHNCAMYMSENEEA